MRPEEESEPLGARTFLNTGPSRAREKAEIYFYFSEGRLGPPHVYMRGPVRARARARAKYKQEKKICSQQAASGAKMQTKIFFEKNFFQKKIKFPFDFDVKFQQVHRKSNIKMSWYQQFCNFLLVFLCCFVLKMRFGSLSTPGSTTGRFKVLNDCIFR